MDQLINLSDLLKHEIKDLYSAEQQIIEALPDMVESASNPQLKTALSDHLEQTKLHKQRLEELMELLGIEQKSSNNNGSFLASLFINPEGEEHCRGMEGLLKEGKKMINGDMSPEVRDAAIIASAQKVEHYEICGYGTARAYARELGLAEAEQIISKTLFDEYDADDLLTSLAVGRLNEEAEEAVSLEGNEGKREATGKKGASKGKSKSAKAAPKKVAGKKAAASKKATPGKVAAKKAAPTKAVSKKPASKKAASKATGKNSAGKGTAAKKITASKKAPARKAAPQVKKAAGKKAAAPKSAKRSAPKKAAKKAAPKKAGRR